MSSEKAEEVSKVERCGMHGPKCLDASVHHFLKYHDPASEFYLGTQCGNCAFSDVQAKWGVAPLETSCGKFMTQVGAGPGGIYCNLPLGHEGQCSHTFPIMGTDQTATPSPTLTEAVNSARQSWQAINGKCSMCAVGDVPLGGVHRGLHKCGEAGTATPVETASRISIEVYQHDWMPGFASFNDDGWIAEAGRAHVTLNLGSLLSAVKTGDLKSKDLPYLIAESLMHEAIHALEAWANVEFSEDRVEELLTKYREKYNRATIWEYTGAAPKSNEVAESPEWMIRYKRCKEYCYCPSATPSGYRAPCGNCVEANEIALKHFAELESQLTQVRVELARLKS